MQKKSRMPWIALIVCVLAVCLLLAVCLATCSRAVSSITENAFSFGASGSAVQTNGDTVAVIHVNGTIESGGTEDPETFSSELQDAQSDPNVKAIVLRVNSGGGTAGSSEEMADAVANCSKPVVVSVADSCASGAYMFASQSDYIITNVGATVGSIGVRMTTYDLTELFNKLGISVESITSGEDKDVGAYYDSLTDDQRAALQEEVNGINDNFIDLVASGRGMERSRVEELATGSTWNGQQALDLGLVDEIGTYEDAIAKAAELGACSSDYDAVSFDTAVSALDSLSSYL